jgi:hypothetical protein
MRKYLFGLFGLAALAAAGFAWAQGIITLTSPAGTEFITVYPLAPGGGPGGGQAQVTINQIRNSTGYLLVATGGTVNTTIPNTVDDLIVTGAITTWNVTFPTAPFDAQLIAESCPGGTATTVVNSATLPAGVAIVGTAVTTCTPAAGGEWQYSASANTWYRIR